MTQESFFQSCRKYFGLKNFYDILDIKPNAPIEEVRRAYYKMSLKLHPDRVEEAQKEACTEKFKLLNVIKSVLIDPRKRKQYDQTGITGGWDTDNAPDFWKDDASNYYRSKVNLSDIEAFQKKYVGSETEAEDIKKAYLKCKGDLDMMTEFICFYTPHEEDRICGIVKGFIEKKEVPAFEKFTEDGEADRLRRKIKYEREGKLFAAEEVIKAKKGKKGNDTDSLILAITRNQQARGNFLDQLEAKYCQPSTSKAAYGEMLSCEDTAWSPPSKTEIDEDPKSNGVEKGAASSATKAQNLNGTKKESTSEVETAKKRKGTPMAEEAKKKRT